jgi:hypothetical protein
MRMMLALVLLTLAAPAFAQEREWSIDTNGENEAYMTYGVPDTVDIGLSLWCKIGGKTLNFFIPKSGWEADTSETVEVKIVAAPAESKVRARLQEDGVGGSASLEAEIPIASPLAKALSDADHIDIDTGKHKVVFPLYEAPVSSLLRLCSAQ